MIPLDRYPKHITLRKGETVTLRPMTPEDAERLWSFYRDLPEIDKAHFQEDVNSRHVVEEWARSIDFASIFPILALTGDRVAGTVTLHRNTTGWKQRVGMVRILIAPDFRHQGLGTTMIREIRHVSEKVGLNYIIAEVFEDEQAATRALERIGFKKTVVYRKFANDRSGQLHNLVELIYPLSGIEEEILY